MNIPKIILYFLIGILHTGCNYTQKNQYVNKIDLQKALNKDLKLNLSDYTKNIQYIKPEYIQEAIPGSYQKVEIINDKVLILDDLNRFFVFDVNGTLLFSLSNRGRGPDEYTNIIGFTLLENEIYLLDNSTKILKYNLKGELIKESRLSSSFLKISNYYGDILLYTMGPWARDNKGYKILILDKQLKEKTRTYHIKNSLEIKAGLNTFISIYSMDGSYSFWESNIDTIFRMNNNFNIFPVFTFSFGPKTRNDIREDYYDSESPSPTNLFETTKYFFIDCNHRGTLKTIFYIKKDKTGGNLVFNYDIIDHGFHNNIDRGFPFWPKGISDKGELFTWFDPMTFRGKFNNEYFSSININDAQKYLEIKDIINSSGEKTNPIIMLCRFD